MSNTAKVRALALANGEVRIEGGEASDRAASALAAVMYNGGAVYGFTHRTEPDAEVFAHDGEPSDGSEILSLLAAADSACEAMNEANATTAAP